MQTPLSQQPGRKACAACEGGLKKLAAEQVRHRLQAVPQWQLTDDGQRIRRAWQVKNFNEALRLFNRVGELAEREGHHPDLHLEGYRNVSIVLWTHAVGGLTENDFILAAQIDRLPVKLRKPR